jgi:hypothetical protein
MTTKRLSLTTDEVRTIQMLAFSAGGAATSLYPDSIALGAISNALNALVNGDVDGALIVLRGLAAESREDAPPPAVGTKYRDGSDDVWTVCEVDVGVVRLTRASDGAPWSLGVGTFATQVRMGYLMAVQP